MKLKTWAGLSAFIAVAALPRTWADTITEWTDAGEMPASANWTSGNAALSLITGWISSASDADIFAIYIDNPAAFSASTAGSTVYDTQLFLFDQNGIGVAANDDIANSSGNYDPRSALPAGSIPGLTSPGIYYISISSWDYDPHSAGGAIFTDDTNYDKVVFNSGPGCSRPISGWDGTGGQNGALGSYQIALTGVSLMPSVPEPGAIGLISIGFIAFCARQLSVKGAATI